MLENILIIAAVIIVALPVFMNTVGPFIVWKTQRIPANVTFLPIDDHEFISERNAEFIAYDTEIKEHGFEVIGSSLLADSHANSYFRLYWSADLMLAAMVVTIKSNIEDITYIEFSQKFSNGTVLDVSNSPRGEVYPKFDFKQAYRYPKKKRFDELFAAYQILAKSFEGVAKPQNYDLSRGFGEVEDFIKKESDALLQKGFIHPEIDEEGKRKLTLRGAAFMTYLAVAPGKNIWGYVTERRANKALKNNERN